MESQAVFQARTQVKISSIELGPSEAADLDANVAEGRVRANVGYRVYRVDSTFMILYTTLLFTNMFHRLRKINLAHFFLKPVYILVLTKNTNY